MSAASVVGDYAAQLGVLTAWLVIGGTGEYSDRSDWYVAIFFDEAQANAYCQKLEDWCRAQKVHVSTRDVLAYTERSELRCPLDPRFSCDYTGTEYFVRPVAVGESGIAAEITNRNTTKENA